MDNNQLWYKDAVVYEVPIKTDEDWPALLAGKTAADLAKNVLPGFLRSRRWFGAKGHTLRAIGITENIPCAGDGRILLLEANYADKMPETYLLPLFLSDTRELGRGGVPAAAAVADLRAGNARRRLVDGAFHPAFQNILLDLIVQGKKLKGQTGDLIGLQGTRLKQLIAGATALSPRVLDVEQSNSAIVYGDRLFLKLYRRLEEGVNPEVEILRFLTEKTSFKHFPAFAGAIEYRRRGRRQAVTAALLLEAVESLSDAWIFVRGSAARFLKRALAAGKTFPGDLQNHPLLPDGKQSELLARVEKLIGGLFREMVELLGKRTAELHLALGSAADDKEFKPEPFSFLYQRSVYQSMQQLTRRTLAGVAKNLALVPKNLRPEIRAILNSEKTILERMRAIAARRFNARKIRVHGDYHLGQILYTGKDFLIIDFEGEPARSLSERRLKQSPLKDVAGMIRSFHYAAYHSLFLGSGFRPEDIPVLNTWVEPWFHLVRGIFLESYLKTMSKSGLLPEDDRELETLLRVYLLEKAVYELGYELNHRPEWLSIPIRGILSLLD